MDQALKELGADFLAFQQPRAGRLLPATGAHPAMGRAHEPHPGPRPGGGRANRAVAPSVHAEARVRVESERIAWEGPGGRARAFSMVMARARAAAASRLEGNSTRELEPPPVRSGPTVRARGPSRPLDGEGTAEAASPSPGGPASCDARRGGVAAPPPAMLGAAAMERLVVELASSGGAASIALAFGSQGILVRLTERPGGLEIGLELPSSLAAGAMAELSALAAAVRARGVAVVRGTVRSRRSAAARQPGHALTAARGSYRTAAQLKRGGTVAKW
jgi:hypothetical protein